jgi:Raf kinase inhibitor-like YbhB/YbcL family protein
MNPFTAQQTILLASDAFESGDRIPIRYTCDGDDISPPLRWSGIPAEAAELALLVEDPDAPRGTFVHWLLWGLDAQKISELAEGSVPEGSREGTNGMGRTGWGGPCPPPGDSPHRYIFTLFALDKPLDLPEGASARELRDAMEGAILAQGELMGTYGR